MFVWAQVHPFSGFGIGGVRCIKHRLFTVRAVPSLSSGGCEESLGHAEWFALTGTGSQTHLYLDSLLCRQPQSLVLPGS